MTERVSLTAGRIADLKCPGGKKQHFLWDLKSPWLAVRVTPSGNKSYVFEAKLNGKTVRITIGSTAAWSIDAARQDANEKQTEIDRGIDPRVVRRKSKQPVRFATKATPDDVLVEEAWIKYLANGRPRKKKAWKPRYVEDLKKAAAAGGVRRVRGKGVTKPGPLHPLMKCHLAELDEDFVRIWYTDEAKRGDAHATRALAMLSGFLGWCGKQPEYRKHVHKESAKPSAHSDLIARSEHRRDALLVSQLPAWFRAVGEDPNPIGGAYLVGLLLTGARREELARLKHEQMDLRWDKMIIADKYLNTREIPIGPNFKRLVASLPRLAGNPYVFWSDKSGSGHIEEPRSVHDRVLKRAQIGHISVHGLRRSFSKLGEAARVPVGAVAQIMGHQPSALAEKYRWREVDELREYLVELEEFILRKAGMLPARSEAGMPPSHQQLPEPSGVDQQPAAA